MGIYKRERRRGSEPQGDVTMKAVVAVMCFGDKEVHWEWRWPLELGRARKQIML